MPSPIRDNAALSRFELEAGGVTAFMNYRLAGDVMTLAHTETPVAARGRAWLRSSSKACWRRCAAAG
jgi:hypothetical protein